MLSRKRTGRQLSFLCMSQVGFKFTGRVCNQTGCFGKLKDQVLDWEDALPDDELEKAEDLAQKAVEMMHPGHWFLQTQMKVSSRLAHWTGDWCFLWPGSGTLFRDKPPNHSSLRHPIANCEQRCNRTRWDSTIWFCLQPAEIYMNVAWLHKGCRFDWLARRSWVYRSCTGGRLAIVNLQKTPKDKDAEMVVHARTDEVSLASVTWYGWK